MRTRTTIAAIVSIFGTTLTLSAQVPAPAPSPTTPARPTTSATAAQTLTNITLVGCLYREQSVPGRTPNVAEKAGVLEDYILADASLPADANKNTTLATGNMYKVENIADEKLQSLVGKRVEVMGKIDPEGSGAPGRAPGGAAPDKGLGPDRINLPEFEASSIKESTRAGAGTCPATAAPRK